MEPTEISHGISTSFNAFDIFSQHVLARPAAGLNVPFSSEEIGSAIKNLKNNKAPDLGGIPSDFLETGSEDFRRQLCLSSTSSSPMACILKPGQRASL